MLLFHCKIWVVCHFQVVQEFKKNSIYVYAEYVNEIVIVNFGVDVRILKFLHVKKRLQQVSI